MTRLPLLLALLPTVTAGEIHVAPGGDDTAPGTHERPLATIAAACGAARAAGRATVVVHAGTYYLPATLVLGGADSGTTIRAADGDRVIVSGGTRLDLDWRPFRDGILQAKTPVGTAPDQLFIDGRRMPMARYPDFDPSVRPYGGFAADALSRERAARWSNPAGGFIHAMHRAHWGGYHYRITGVNADGSVAYEGGWQNNRRMGMHPQHRFVENIFEELDAPGEWYHDAGTATLYHLPEAGTDLGSAIVEVVRLPRLLEIRGTREQPARGITVQGITFRHSARTFMETREPLLRSDWTIHRGGAVVIENAENCTLADCEIDQPGGNAVFVSNYNRRILIRGCHIHDCGASAVAFVGDPAAVRNPLFEYNERQAFDAIDTTPGPLSDNHPADCVVEDCLLHGIGRVEKQAAGVQVSMSRRISVRHCSIYDASRAGINISEGTFGGHLVEGCDVFDTVLETGDHGSFNSWGRDRFWGLRGAPADRLPELALLDAVETTVLRNNRWRCDHGWDVDLDDGSSNYRIENNLFLHGGLKLREGFHRTVRNNIAVGNTLHPHVWYPDSGDVVESNIWMGAYRPALMDRLARWGRSIDRNLFTTGEADRDRFSGRGCDARSLAGDPMFVDPEAGDFRVRDGSPALALGFVNFPMDRFGVRVPALRRIARTPEIPVPGAPADPVPAAAHGRHWLGASVRDLEGDEFSAFGVSREAGGVQLVEVPRGSPAAAAGLRTGDLVQQVDGTPAPDIASLLRRVAAASGRPIELGLVRDQRPQTVRITRYPVLRSEDAPGPQAFESIRPGAAPVPVAAVASRPETRNEPLASLHDGRLAADYGPVFANGVRGGCYKVDLGRSQTVAAVSTWSHHLGGRRGPQQFRLYGSDSATDPGWDLADRGRFTPLAEVDTTGRPPAAFHATRIEMSDRSPLGRYRWLVWVLEPVTPLGENTAVQELEVSAR